MENQPASGYPIVATFFKMRLIKALNAQTRVSKQSECAYFMAYIYGTLPHISHLGELQKKNTFDTFLIK